MKKKLEADLMSIAHRVLQMKNKSDVNQLCIETRRLYEKLAVLQFVEEHFEGVKPTIGQAEIVEKMKQFFEENHLSDIKPIKIQEKIAIEEAPIAEIIAEETIITEVVIDKHEEIEEILEEEVIVIAPEEEIISESSEERPTEVDFLPTFELDEVVQEEKIEEEKIQTKPEEVQISFIDLLGGDYTKTLFVKVDENLEKANPLDFDLPKETNLQKERAELLAEIEVNPKDIEAKAVSLNEKLSQGISIGLNDRLGFVKNLFGNSDEDYNRVLNQLITYDNFEEARNFIEDMVKPDYGDWTGKEEYEQRFLEIIEKKFA